MIKKNCFALSLIFMLFLLPINLFGQVSVKIINMSNANGTPISDKGPIKISSGQDTRILFTVNITRPESQVMNGNLFIYSKRNSSSDPIVLSSAQYISSSSWSTTISISKDVNLSPAEYDNSSGLLYAEFESIGGSTYKSDNWAIQKETGNTPPPPPTVSYPSVNTISASYQAGNGFIPIIKNRNSLSGSNTINVSTSSEFDISMYVEYIIPTNFDCSATPMSLNLYKQKGNNTPIFLKNVIGPSYIDKFSPCGGLRNYGTSYKLSPSDLSEGDFKMFIGITYSGSIKAKSSIITISPKSVPLISGNSFDAGGVQEIIIGSKAEQIWSRKAPIHSDRILGTANATFTYQWQKKINNEWTNISGATSLNYSPGVINDFLSEYRRIAISSLFSITHISITAKITAIMVNDNNIICCNQQVLSGQVPQKLVGSTPQGIGSFTYEWEKKTRTQWDVVGTSKDYAPDAATLGRRPRTTAHYYRRKVIPGNGSTIIYSNEVKITISPSSSSSSIITNEYMDESNIESLYIYPNPSSNLITVKSSEFELSDSEINIYDQQGLKMNNYKVFIDGDLLNINIENLHKGIYILTIETPNNEIRTNKIIKN